MTEVVVKEIDNDNYTERKEYNSKWSNQSYKIAKIEIEIFSIKNFVKYYI